MRNLTLSAFADEYSDVLIEQLCALNKFGIEYLELRHADGKNVSEMTKDDVNEVKKKLQDFGVKVSSIGSPLGKISIDGDIATHMETAKRICETAQTLGAKNIRMFIFYLPDGANVADYKGKVFDALESMVKISEEYGVTLCHENEAKIYGESPKNCLEIMEHFNGSLKCVLDMGNFVLDGFNPMDAYKLLYDYIEYFHIKDALYAGAIVPAGKGEAQIKEILTDYSQKTTRETFITLEPHLQTFAGLNALVGKSFENPYKYENQQTAFIDAVNKLKEIVL